MMDYYNDFDPTVCDWLEGLIRDGLIPQGVVDRRSILDVEAHELSEFRRCHFFAGIGGWALALDLAAVPDDLKLWTGSPPCFPAGTLILTKGGYAPIESVRVGDEVLTHKGRWRPVTAVGGQLADTVEVKGQGHFGIITTRDHPFLTYGDEWTPAGELIGKRWATVASVPSCDPPKIVSGKHGYFFDKRAKLFRVRGEKGGRRVYVGGFRHEADAIAARDAAVREGVVAVRGCDAVDSASLDFARFLGYWLGDGWVSRNDIFICGGHNDQELLRKISAAANIPMNVTTTRTGCRAYVGSKGLSAWLRDNFGAGASKKRLPTWLHGMSESYRAAFLDGYWLADGHDENPKNGGEVRRFTTTSRALAIGIRVLLNQAGKSASVSKHTPNRRNVIEGRLVGERPFYRVTAYAKARSFHFEGLHGWGLVRQITNAGKCEVYNLAVDEDESYTADGLVVHNCQPFSAAGKQKGKEDDRHLAPHFAKLIADGEPDLIFGEQVASKEVLGRAAKPSRKTAAPGTGSKPVEWCWLDDLFDRLEAAHYACGASDLSSAVIGAPHIRQRTFFGAIRLADDMLQQRQIAPRTPDVSRGWCEEPAEIAGLRGNLPSRAVGEFWRDADWLECRDETYRPVEPGTFPLAYGVSGRMAARGAKQGGEQHWYHIASALKGFGNAINPWCAKEFIEAFLECA